MKVRSIFSGLKKLFGAAAVILSMWTAMITGFFLGNTIVILIHADGYREATFTIEQLLFQKGGLQSNQPRGDQCYALGTVDGQDERFSLSGYLQGVISSREDLESQVHVGQKLKVLYNPDVPKNTKMRVLYPDRDFKLTWKRRQRKMIRTGYGPWLVAIALCLLFGIVAGETRSAIKWSIGACVFVVLSWMPLLYNYFS
jgi:hypothetical protein